MATSNIRLPIFRHSIETARIPRIKQTIPDINRNFRIVNKSFSIIGVVDFIPSFYSASVYS